jgi:hypothetical protein
MAKRFFLCALIYTLLMASAYGQEYHWYRGNTHTHTNQSDGDSPPDVVVKWYSTHHYNFLVITDHNKLTQVKDIYGADGSPFILIPGEEVTESLGKRPVHLCGINIGKFVEPRHGKTVDEILRNDIEAIHEAGGIAQINHPNWKWAFTEREMGRLKNGSDEIFLLEIYNMNKDNNNYGGGGHIGTEDIWDRLLSRGMKVYGIVSEDSHKFAGEYDADRACPGRGWLMVKAPVLKADEIVKALIGGNFYGTNGIDIRDVSVTEKEYVVDIKPHKEFRYTTIFIGKDGEILKKDYNNRAVYLFTGKEKYVRAKVLCSSGDFAITQPVFMERLRKKKQGS